MKDIDGAKAGDPWKVTVENLNSRVLEAVKQDGTLDMRDWHTCETTHCWAGWIVTLAGVPGKMLEDQTSTEFAAMVIFRNSTGKNINPGYFYLGNDEAMKKIEELAS